LSNADAEGNQAPSSPVGGRTDFGQPVYEKLVRQAIKGIRGLRLEPLGSGGLGKFLGRKPRQVTATQSEDRLDLNIDLQVEYGRRIPELVGEAQRAITEEVRRLTGHQELTINVRVRGLFGASEEGGA
jgi:uncharacterized alkaline shock family protein YloU